MINSKPITKAFCLIKDQAMVLYDSITHLYKDIYYAVGQKAYL